MKLLRYLQGIFVAGFVVFLGFIGATSALGTYTAPLADIGAYHGNGQVAEDEVLVRRTAMDQMEVRKRDPAQSTRKVALAGRNSV